MALNITIYSKVPLQKNYQNVFNISQDAFEEYLNTFYEGEIINVKSYFDGGDSIDLPKLYENCNYMRINDTNSPQAIKYYFIDNTQFKAGATVQYNITLDVWHTYKYNITNFYPSLMIRGHADAVGGADGIIQLNSCKVPTLLNRSNAYLTHLTNYLIEPLNIETNTTRRVQFLATVSTSDGIKILLVIPSQLAMLNYNSCLASLYKNKFWYKVNNQIHDTTYEILKLYCIVDVDFETAYGTNQSYEIYNNDTATLDGVVYMRCFDLKKANGNIQSNNAFSKKLTLISKTIYNTSNADTTANRLLRSKRRVLIGAMNNNKELNTTVAFNDNPTMYLNMYIQETNSIQFMFEVENTKIDITSNFELPTVNDSYTLYMNLNEKQIENANITNAVTYLMSSIGIVAGAVLSPLTAGASLGLTALGVAGATTKFIGSETGLNAKIQDAKNNLDRLDNTNTNIGLTFNYGIGAFEFEFNDDYLSEKYNRFGTENQTYILRYAPTDIQKPNYNFTFIQLQDANFIGEFNENIKSILKTIFENGVRMWYDYTTFLTNVNYKKAV